MITCMQKIIILLYNLIILQLSRRFIKRINPLRLEDESSSDIELKVIYWQRLSLYLIYKQAIFFRLPWHNGVFF